MINYHTSTATLSIYAFDQISKTGDVSLLLHEGEKAFPYEVAYKKWEETKQGWKEVCDWKKYGGGELNPEYVLYEVIEQDENGNEVRAKFSVDREKVWSDMFNSRNDNVGTPQEIEKARRLRAKATRLYEAAYCKEGQRYKITFAKKADRDADDILKKLGSNEHSLERTCASLSKYMSYDVDSKTTTVDKFDNLIELAKKESE